MLNLLAITLLAVIVKNPGMMQNINGAMDTNYDDVNIIESYKAIRAEIIYHIVFRNQFQLRCHRKSSQRLQLSRPTTTAIIR